MNIAPVIVGIAAGLAAGAFMVWLIFRFKADVARLETTLENEKLRAAEKLELLTAASDDLKNAFKALSLDALKSNTQSFLDLAKGTLEKYQAEAKGDLDQRKKAVENLVSPVRESLDKVVSQIHSLENARREAYGGLIEQVKSLSEAGKDLRRETGNLVSALRSPNVRGRWGEIQLKKVVEIAGMLPYCDFEEQASVTTEDGRMRPDLIVKLPGGKNVVVDAKAPLQAYLEALESQDEEKRQARLKDHARQVRDHMLKLSTKAYWEQFKPAPEFVIMFLPGETFFSAALEQDPGLIEAGVNQSVILATPTTLIALLKAVAYGWRQERIAESAQEISKLGRELYERLCTLSDHFIRTGKGLDQAVKAFNDAVGSLESRVMPSARRFTELGVDAKKEIAELTPVEKTSRKLQSTELLNDPATEGEAPRELSES